MAVQKRVELARALIASPRLLLLDEPMAGMSAGEKAAMSDFIRGAHEQYATTIILIEHDMGVVMELSDHITVLDHGKRIAKEGRRPFRAIRTSSTPISASPMRAMVTTTSAARRCSRHERLGFFLEVLVAGLAVGVMYSLVAIGFVLIYKTSGVLNFAQGAMLLFAALTFVSLHEKGVSFPLALLITLVIMVALGIAIERFVLRPMAGQPPITLFMVTLGLSYIIEGGAELIWGTQVHGLDLGIEDTPMQIAGVLVSRFRPLLRRGGGGDGGLARGCCSATRAPASPSGAAAEDPYAALNTGLRLPADLGGGLGDRRGCGAPLQGCSGGHAPACSFSLSSSC